MKDEIFKKTAVSAGTQGTEDPMKRYHRWFDEGNDPLREKHTEPAWPPGRKLPNWTPQTKRCH